MLFAAFLFSIMGVCVKLATPWYSTSEIVMVRGLIGVLFLTAWIMIKGGSFKTALPWQHVWRGGVGSASLWLWFYAIGKLPLATAITLNYMSSIWITAIVFGIGWWRGRQRFEYGLAGAIVVSFIGVVLLLRPAIDAAQWFAGMLALLSSVMTALAYLQVRRLGRLGEPEYRIVFYFSVTGMVTGLIGMLLDRAFSAAAATPWPAGGMQGMALLIGVGLFATIAQMAMTRAYRLGRVLVTANLQYTGIVFASLWGILLWNDILPAISWAGMSMIVLSGIAATYYNARSTPAATASVAAKM